MAAELKSWRDWRGALLTCCLFALVVGTNWATFARFGSDMPDWDQWDAEGVNLLAPWFENDHFLAHLFEPHNEHRVVLTKLQNLAVVSMAKQWDSRAECCMASSPSPFGSLDDAGSHVPGMRPTTSSLPRSTACRSHGKTYWAASTRNNTG